MNQGAALPLSVMQAIAERRSVRSYKKEAVPRVVVEKLLGAAVKAPTAMHEEPWAFVVIQDEATLRELSAGARAMIDTARRGHVADFFREDFDIFHGAGTLIVICARPANPFVAADCWLAAENLMLAAHAMGLGTCVIGFALQVLNQSAWKERLGIAADMEVFVPIILGVPAGPAQTVPRKEPQIISWI